MYFDSRVNIIATNAKLQARLGTKNKDERVIRLGTRETTVVADNSGTVKSDRRCADFESVLN